MAILRRERHLLTLIFIFTFLFSILHSSIDLARAGQKTTLTDGEKIYTHYCSACHGINGDGNGFNARNLDPRPANHTDAVLMTKRSDSELYDAINGGGKAVGKSTLMPPWGNTLDKAQIKSLVMYLRKLCMCQEEK